jgi:hypothetical protein
MAALISAGGSVQGASREVCHAAARVTGEAGVLLWDLGFRELERLTYGADQGGFAEGLPEIGRARLCALASGRIVVAGDADRRDRGARADQVLLEVESAHSTEVDVEDETGRRSRRLGGQST